jgi:hypothetical protein
MVKIELIDAENEAVRSVELYPSSENQRQLEYVVELPLGLYQLDVVYEFRSITRFDKNEELGWTRVGGRHQIRLEGEEHRFPPPKETR